ncbi:hypothetical protein LOTGIDRAFT_130513 [Lottia gigantea]|uniref:Trafficking protein particle complex subunit 9 n=1 Tax=Lottia gigantea TaxID=225164 RepID=V3ZRV9_LOTGI|nr:hypothetical protein LOTGIDRAFT_130513 [Lottia gigantea]ESO85285.1 hypothetical protein LOTGIDRAFT_130513 [Lottia gigantea]
MSFIDYGQTAEDHQSLLVLVRHTGTHITNHTFLPAWERVRKINCIHVEGQKRNVFVRYKRTYPVENNTWGDFQTHRKVLGLVSIGKCSTSAEFEALFEDYKKMKENYANTIYNSRLIVFGMNTDGTPFLNENTNLNSIVFYPDLDSAKDLEERLREFVTSLFYVLEGKRLDRSFERADRLQLLCAPSEVKDFVGVDTDTRSFKKKCTGRLRKHLADLCLQAGMPGEAILHYQTAIDLLRNVNDFLWIGGCYEGLSSSSVIMAHPKISAAASIKRNLSFTDKRMAAINLDKNKAGRTNFSGVGFANGLDLADIPNGPGLNPEDIIEKYREAITHYSKFKTAGKIEMEASLKACRVLIGQRKYLQASDFLQNVVYIDLKVSEEDKIQRFGTLATLYTQIGFHRKAGFFKRIAGMQCVAPQTSAWQQCYQLLLQTLQGYKIFLETRNTQTTGSDSNKGWPTLRHRILTELVYAARRMGNPQLAVRHMSFLLHTMFEHLSTAERREAVTGLMSLTSKCEGSAQSIALDNGQILPPVPLTKFPLVKSFTIMNLPPHLQPIEKNTDPNKKPDVFIFTPIQQTDKDSNSLQSKVSFVWVKDEICEVELYVVNPLPDELRISYMALLTEGVEVEVFPSNPSIPSESKTSLVKLQCKPKSIGDLKIIGYTTHVLGVNSKCYLKHLHHLEKKPMTVEVVPALPQVTLRSSLPKAANFSSLGDGLNVVANSSISVFAGQSQECTISLENVGKIPVSGVAVSVNSKPEVKG